MSMRRGRERGGGAGRGRGGGMGNGRGRGLGRGSGRGPCAGMGAARQPAIDSMLRDSGVVQQLAKAHADPIVALVDASRCTGCGVCIDACPDKAISVNDVAAVEPRLCVGCGACVRECPNEALALGRVPLERGATG